MKNLHPNPDRPLSFAEQEQQCKELFLSRGPFYHLCTPGEGNYTLFEDEIDLCFMMNLVALCREQNPGMNILTFEVMRSHLHLVGEGDAEDSLLWFANMRKRLLRFYQSTGRVKNLDAFKASLFPIDNLPFLRNTIAYVNRNGYLVHPEHTPFSYPWGAGRYFFNPDACKRYDLFYGDLTVKQKRQMFCSHSVHYPAGHLIVDGYISPFCYCDLSLAEHIFRDARHYFNQISRPVEGYNEIAKLLGDSIFCTDDELYLITRQISRDKFGVARPETLPPDWKRELARTLHFDYRAGDRQIQRMLRLEDRTLRAFLGK